MGSQSFCLPSTRERTFLTSDYNVRKISYLIGTRVSPGTVSKLNKQIYGRIELWRNRPITTQHPYIYLDGLYLKRSWGGEVRNVAILVAVGVDGKVPGNYTPPKSP